MKINAGQAPSTLIPEYIGSDFDKVITVLDNIDDIKTASTNITNVVAVGDNILNVNTVAADVDDVTLVADNIGFVKDVAEGIEGLPVSGYIGDTPPTQPKVGATWYCTLDGRSYTWYEDADSGQWVESHPQSGGVPVSVYIGNTPPLSPEAGATWYCTLDGRNYIWHEYDNSGQWVESSPQSDIAAFIDKMTLNADATDVTTAIALVNQIRAGLIANGLAE